jgi:hypothetical protein
MVKTGFVNYKEECTRLAAASDKVYQLLAHGRWFSPGTPASSTSKTVRHDIALVNFITCGCESSALFFVIYKAGLHHYCYLLLASML